MDTLDVIKAIQKQVDAASPILKRISCLHAAPVRPSYNGQSQASGKVRYDATTIRVIEEDIDSWQHSTRAVLAACFGGKNDNKDAFERTVVKHRLNHDAKMELEKEVKAGRDVLSTIIEEESQKSTLHQRTAAPNAEQRKCPKVFISHKREDKEYADALVNLINFIIGADGDKIFCSSVPGYGIRPSRDIIDELKAQFEQHDVFMVIIHSPRYYESPICLNEMGASWVLGTKFSSFMTSDCYYDDMRGVINNEKICINPNDEDGILNTHLNDFKDDLTSFFGAQAVDQNKWENARSRFVCEVRAIKYKSVSK